MMYSMETLVRESVELMNLVLSDKFKECFFYFFIFLESERAQNKLPCTPGPKKNEWSSEGDMWQEGE